MQIYFCSDAHLGHRNIHKFRDAVSSPQENTEMFMVEASQKLNRRTIVFFLGDTAFNDDSLIGILGGLPGRKILISGNHEDMTSMEAKNTVFESIHGMLKYKEFWLTHAPIHPQELRGKTNIHGHVHKDTIDDPRYFNTCPEATGQYLISLQEIRGAIRDRQYGVLQSSAPYLTTNEKEIP